MNYIAYYRVSTKTQGESGLGLEAQRRSVSNYIGEGNMSNVTEVVEVESGKNNNRPMLQEAISQCLVDGSTLVIAKLDRLSRNASFTLRLMETKVRFIAVDMPNANELTIGIMALLAQDEAKRISQRTKSALAEIRSKIDSGVVHVSKSGNRVNKLGTPANLTSEGRLKSAKVRRERALNNENNRRAYALIKRINDRSLSFTATCLNSSGFKTINNKDFTATAVARLIKLYNEKR